MKTRIRGVRLRIRYERRSDLVALAALLALVLATAVFLGCLAWGPEEAAASGTQAPRAAFADMRKYYRTQEEVYARGDEALTACAPGYHMASLWEILDTSNLEYNSDLGVTQADSGAGPPTSRVGWVRTGWDSEAGTGIPGQNNCEAWTSADPAIMGTIAVLNGAWTDGTEDVHVWTVEVVPCGAPVPVWCVEDINPSVYLPLALKD